MTQMSLAMTSNVEPNILQPCLLMACLGKRWPGGAYPQVLCSSCLNLAIETSQIDQQPDYHLETHLNAIRPCIAVKHDRETMNAAMKLQRRERKADT